MISGFLILETLDHLGVKGLQLFPEGFLVHDQALPGTEIIPEPDGIHPLIDQAEAYLRLEPCSSASGEPGSKMPP